MDVNAEALAAFNEAIRPKSELFYLWLYAVWEKAYDAGAIEEEKLSSSRPFKQTFSAHEACMADLNCLIVTIVRDGKHVAIKASDPKELKKYGAIPA